MVIQGQISRSQTVWNLLKCCVLLCKQDCKEYSCSSGGTMHKSVVGRVVFFWLCVQFSGIAFSVETDDIVIVPKVVLDETGYAGDLAINPTNGSLHCIWPSHFGILTYASRTIDGVWSNNEIIPTLGLPVYAFNDEEGVIWIRKSCGVTVDEHGVVHIVYGVEDGDCYYVAGNSGNWSEPYKVMSKSRPTCFPEIEVIDDNLYIIWEDASRNFIKEVFFVTRINNVWSIPKIVMFADNPDLISSDQGILYLSGRLFNHNWPDYDYDHNALLSHYIPGFVDWETVQVTHSQSRVGKAPRLAVYDGKIYMSWSRSQAWESLGGDWDKKGELHCAVAQEPGVEWEAFLGTSDPLYTVATGDPYGVVASYSDGTIFYANGKAGPLAVNSTRFFRIYNGENWSTIRMAEWDDGIAHLASDGKTVWALAGSAQYTTRPVTLSGYTNPYADHLDFANEAPQITVFPDTLSLSNSLWRSRCQAVDPDGDPVTYALTYGPEGCSVDAESGLIQWQTAGIDTQVIGVMASDNRGKKDVYYFRLHVIEHAYNISFTADPTEGTAPLSAQFVNLSQGNIDQYVWDFGDGQSSTLENPVHVYTDPGTYTVKLKVTGNAGSDSVVQADLINVNPVPVVAGFGAAPIAGIAPLTVQFTDSSAGNITSWLWDFGDGGISTEQHPVHVYQEPDTYSVSLTVSGLYNDNNATRSDYIQVRYPAPVADFEASPRTGEVSLAVQFTDHSTGVINEWNWTFGDGSTSQTQNPAHTYTEPGEYQIGLTVTGPGGSDTKTISGYIQVGVIDPPQASFSADPLSGYAPLTVQFTNTSTGSDLNYKWYFGDYSVENGGTSTEMHPAYTYQEPGTYSVILTAIGPDSSHVNLQHNLIQVLESTRVGDANVIPDDFAVHQNHPNPFNMDTRIRYDLPESGMITISVYDARGKKVKTLIRETKSPGQHSIHWNGTDQANQVVPSGIYIVKMVTDSYTGQVKVLLIK